MGKPVTDIELEQAVACRLIDSDGTRWEVRDVTIENGRAWVRAQCMSSTDDGSSASENGDDPSSVVEHASEERRAARPRVFDTILTSGARLIWFLPDGGRVIARGNGNGELHWVMEDDESSPAGTGASNEFFADPFLNT